MWSTVATSSAMRSGWLSGRTCTAVPIRIRRVRAAIALATWREAEMTERLGVKWISPSQTQSTPPASARSAVSKMSRNAPAWVAPWRSSSTKIPKCTTPIVTGPRGGVKRGRGRGYHRRSGRRARAADFSMAKPEEGAMSATRDSAQARIVEVAPTCSRTR